jgi:cysteine desulfurase
MALDLAKYFDNAAATPVDERVLAEMLPFLNENFYNPSSIYLASRAVKQTLQTAREDVAHWLGARPSEIFFTAGATEANNLAIEGVIGQNPNTTVVLSVIEHESVLEVPSKEQARFVGVDERGMVRLSQLENAIDDTTCLVSIMYANNEIGTVQPLKEIADLISKLRDDRRSRGIDVPLYFHTDASQAANYLDLHINKLNVDMMTLNSAKTYGPKQVGALYVRSGTVLKPLIVGGGQEKGLRSGTENVAGAVGFAKALSIAQKMRHDEAHRLEKLSQKMVEELLKIDDAQLLGHKKHRLANIVSILFSKLDGERLVMMLDEQGFQVATGSACSALSDESSHVVKALGFSDEEAKGSIRISLGRMTTERAVDELVAILPDLVKEARLLT